MNSNSAPALQRQPTDPFAQEVHNVEKECITPFLMKSLMEALKATLDGKEIVRHDMTDKRMNMNARTVVTDTHMTSLTSFMP